MNKRLMILLGVMLVLMGAPCAQTIETYAGSGPPQLEALESNTPGLYGAALDGEGNLYFSSWILHRVFRADASGTVTVVAGTGLAGFSGDGSAATEAKLNHPAGVVIDSNGRLYIADSGNNRIRRVNADGAISTVAGSGELGFLGDGGNATDARLAGPRAVALDDQGNLLIADRKNNRIRKVDMASGTITTIAGNGQARYAGDEGPAVLAALVEPTRMAVDTTGDLYIADTGNHCVRRIDIQGMITTVTGNGQPGFEGDGVEAAEALLNKPLDITFDELGNLYIADSGNHRIRKIDRSTAAVSTVVGDGFYKFRGDGGPALTASLGSPGGVVFDEAGNLYIVDSAQRRIRQVEKASGVIKTLVGDGSFMFSGEESEVDRAGLQRPIGLTFDSQGNLFVSDALNHRIRKIDRSTRKISTVAGAGLFRFERDGRPAAESSFRSPMDLEWGQDGTLFIADSHNQRIRKLDPVTGTITTVAGTGSRAFSGDEGLAIEASLADPLGIALDKTGGLLIADTANHRIRRVDLETGLITTVAGTGTKGYGGDGQLATIAMLASPADVAVDSGGNIFIADADNHRVRKIDSATGVILSLAGTGIEGERGDGGLSSSAELVSPSVILVDGAGNVFVSDPMNNRVRKIDSATGIITTVAGDGSADFLGDGGPASEAGLQKPWGLALDSDGNLYIADSLNHRIRRVSSAGVGY